MAQTNDGRMCCMWPKGFVVTDIVYHRQKPYVVVKACPRDVPEGNVPVVSLDRGFPDLDAFICIPADDLTRLHVE